MKVESAGKIESSTSTRQETKKKGSVTMNILPGFAPVTAAATKKLKPTGGDRKPSTRLMTTTTPKCTGSMP